MIINAVSAYQVLLRAGTPRERVIALAREHINRFDQVEETRATHRAKTSLTKFVASLS